MTHYQESVCRWCSASFIIDAEDLDYLQRLSPSIGGQLLPLPAPTLCPACRIRRRLSFRNDQNYYRGECSLCAVPLITIYSPDKRLPILCEGCYWSDRWDPYAYGRQYDFDRPFFEQFAEMKAEVPRLAIFNTISENSKFTVHASRNKNCYMSSSLIECEDVCYSDFLGSAKNSIDLFSGRRNELCYECSHSEDCYASSHLELCYGLTESYQCYDCRGCNSLVGCAGLRKTDGYILNRPASIEECRSTVHRLNRDPEFKRTFDLEFENLKMAHPRPAYWGVNSEGSTGNYLTNCKDVTSGFNVRGCRDSRHVYECFDLVDSYDATRVANGEMLYECKGIVDLKYSAFCNLTYQCSLMIYCDNCQAGCQNCFGCMSLKRGEYSILNVRYSPAEYQKIAAAVAAQMQATGEWGEFFPPELSPFGYNETKASDIFPLERQTAVERGWHWSDYEQPLPHGVSVIDRSTLPLDIDQVGDEVLKSAIRCEESGRPFRIVAQELEFYRSRGLPIPAVSPRVRLRRRIARQNRPVLYNRFCDECGAGIVSTYETTRPEIVFCEGCYLKRVY